MLVKSIPKLKMKMIPCTKCTEPMPELRKTQYGYSFCVNCSDGHNLVSKKKALPIQKGEGDHTWNEIVIMDEADYNKAIEQEEANIKENKKLKSDKVKIIDPDK